MESTSSTNDDLQAAAVAQTATDRSVLVADHQTAGRGRLNRRWDAPAGANLLCSILMCQIDPHIAQHVVALSLVGAARDVADYDATLKWPNDIVSIDEEGSWHKIAGMLSTFVPGTGVIVGIGINLGWAPEGASRIVDPEGAAPDRWDLLRALLKHIDRLRASDSSEVLAEYRLNLDTIGRRVRVELPDDRVLEGRAISVADTGELRVIDACAVTHQLAIGDVIHLRDG